MKLYNEDRNGARESKVKVREIIMISHELDWITRVMKMSQGERQRKGGGSLNCRSPWRSKGGCM